MRVEHKKEEKKPEKFIPPQPIGKVATIISLAVASTALFWWAWEHIITSGLSFEFNFQNIFLVVSTLLALCLMLTIVAMAEVLITKKLSLLLMAIFSSATLFIFFKPSLWTSIGFLLMLLAFMAWRREIRQDEKTRVKFVPQQVINSGLKMAVSLILLSACFNYYSFMVVRPNSEEHTLDSLVHQGSVTIENVLDLYYQDEFDPTMSLDSFIENISLSVGESIINDKVNIDTGNEEVDATLGLVIAEGLTAAQSEIADEAKESFLDTFKIEASGEESMNEIIDKIVRKNTIEYIDPYLKFVPALLAVSLFFLLNIFNFIYREFIKAFSYLLFKVLVWTKFIHLKKVQVEAEKISLSE